MLDEICEDFSSSTVENLESEKHAPYFSIHSTRDLLQLRGFMPARGFQGVDQPMPNKLVRLH